MEWKEIVCLCLFSYVFLIIFSLMIKSICEGFRYNKHKTIKILLSLGSLAFTLERSYHVIKGEELFNLLLPLVISILNLMWLNKENQKLDLNKTKESRWHTALIIICSTLLLLIQFVVLSVLKISSNEYKNVLHILVKDSETAQEVISKLKSGHDFCQLVIEYSQDEETHDKCGNLKYSKYEYILHLIPNPEVVENRSVTRLYNGNNGYHIILWKN